MRRTHGSERRGVFPTPSAASVGYQRDQARQDKAALLEKIRAKHLTKIEQQELATGLGNKELPAFRHKHEIIEAIESTRAIILGGETGCGKSTQVPQFLYEANYDKTYVLVPRRIIADKLGDRIREELTDQLNTEAENAVGIVHGERVDLHDDNRIVVLTADTFNGMLPDIENEYKDKKIAIIADEIHEANLFIEIATGTAATAVQKYPSWRLIASSATHNAETLKGPFERINGEGSEVPVVTIEGRPFKVDLKEEPEKTPMEVYASFDIRPDKTMIFTSGKREIEYIIDKTRDELERRAPESSAKVVFRKLHGELTEFELMHVDDPVPEGYKLVIVSSPAGMSGITISGATCVITDGTINRPKLDNDGASGLQRCYLSRAGITQEIGRAGRDVAGGVGILAKPITIDEDRQMLYSSREPDFPEMPFRPFEDKGRLDHEPAEIYHSNLGRVVLRLAALNRRFVDINDYIPHQVAPSAIISAEQSLSRLGALDDSDKITDIGKLMNRFPLSPELSRGVAEAFINGRPLQHLARTAIIAAAVEQGGLQDFSKKTNRWQAFIRPSTRDDFIAQLDITLGIADKGVEGDGSERERYSIYDNDLHPKKLERSRKAARKILSIFNMRPENLVLTPPTYEEEALLRRDFTAGMIELVYEHTNSRNKKHYYRNIHGDVYSTERYVSRSVAKPIEDELIAGFPRWFEKRLPHNKIQHNDVVEQILAVDKEDVIHFAIQHGATSSRPLPPKLVGDKIVELEQPTFGSLDIRKPMVNNRESIPEASQKLIVQMALEKQGAAQRALRLVIEELAQYRAMIPPEELAQYRKSNVPEDITPALIEGLVREYAKEVRSLTHIDRKIAYYVYSKGIGINRYYDDDARIAMQERSPKNIRIGEDIADIYYHNGQPYVRRVTRAQRPHAANGVYLPDGREVLLRVVRKGTDVHLISLKENSKD